MVLAAAQFGVVAFGPAVDALGGAGAPSHVESSGTHLHYAHNPDDCAACAASTMVGDLPRLDAAPVPESARTVHRPTRTTPAAERHDVSPKSPRAPPFLPALAR